MSEEPARGQGSCPARAGQAARVLIRRTRQLTRRQFPAEEKIRIVLEGIRGEVAVSELCRCEEIHPTIYYKWLKDSMEAGKGRMRGESGLIFGRPRLWIGDGGPHWYTFTVGGDQDEVQFNIGTWPDCLRVGLGFQMGRQVGLKARFTRVAHTYRVLACVRSRVVEYSGVPSAPLLWAQSSPLS
jgi:hypothetical protein